MIWFHRLFPPALMLTALIFTVCVKRRPGPNENLQRATMARLVIATLIFIGLHAGVQTWLEASYPLRSMPRMLWPTLIAVFGTVTLSILFMGPALAARNPGFGGTPDFEADLDEPGGRTATRSASLISRSRQAPLTKRAWTIGWSLFALCSLITLWSIAEGAHPALALGLMWWIGMSFFGTRAAHLTPEPMNPTGSTELSEAYAESRAFRAWGFFTLGLAGTVGYSAICLIILWVPTMAGNLGALIGTGLGLAGATFGVVSSIRQAKARAVLHDLA